MNDRQHPPAQRAVGGLLAAGGLFLDVVFAGLSGVPRLGEEQWTSEFGWGPGGIANFAIASSRLGCPTAIAAAVGHDPLSDLARSVLVAERVDTTALRSLPGWRLPVTAGLGWDRDRALVTGGTPAPIPLPTVLAGAPLPAVATVHVEPGLGHWISHAAAGGTKVFADLGWDSTGAWDTAVLDDLDGCHAFLPNDLEAMAYTRTDTPEAAMYALADRVPLSVVTLGGRGVLAVDSATGEQVVAPPVIVEARDTTGAGDVFGAALAVATLTGWPLRARVDVAALVAAICVSRLGGAAGAPRWDELVPWLDAHPDVDGGRFDFLREAAADSPSSLPLLSAADPVGTSAGVRTGSTSDRPLTIPTPR